MREPEVTRVHHIHIHDVVFVYAIQLHTMLKVINVLLRSGIEEKSRHLGVNGEVTVGLSVSATNWISILS